MTLKKGCGSQVGSRHVLLVERGTMGNAYWVAGVVLDVVNMDTK